jgi:6-phosphogluconolactonase (cycloisomerase 2 family)
MMKTWMSTLLVMVVVLASIPVLVAGGTVSGKRMEAIRVSKPLKFVEAHIDNGLNGAYSVAVSPDDKHLYAVGYKGNAVTVFSREGTRGELALVAVYKDTDLGVDGLEGAKSVAVSPDGNHVYVVGYFDGAVAVFCRDGATGELTFVEVKRADDPDVFYMLGASSVTVSPDGAHVYVAAYVNRAVVTFSRNPATGALNWESMALEGAGEVDGLEGVRSVAVSPDGLHVYAGGSTDDAVAVFSRDGSTGKLTFVEVYKDTDPDVDGLDKVESVAVSPDGDNVYVAGHDDDAVAVFSRNGSTGELTFMEVHKETDPGVDGLNGAHSVAVSADGSHVYVIGTDFNAVAMFSRDGATGALNYIGRRTDNIGGVEGMYLPYAVAVSPDGANAYVAAYGEGAVTTFSRDPTTGQLSFEQVYPGVDGVDGAIGVAVSADGEHVYVTGNDDGAVALFSRNGATGGLTFEEVYKDTDYDKDGLDQARSVVLSPDGGQVYVAGCGDSAVAVFDRDGDTGELTFKEVHKDSDPGVDGLIGIQSLSVSPDGKHVYTAAGVGDAVAIFSRDEITGGLSYVGVVKDSDPGVDGLDGAYEIAFGPGGTHVYVVGYTEDAVTLFNRDVGTGALSYVGTMKDGDPGVDGLNGASSVAVSPDGSHVYVAGRNDDAVVIFGRDGSTGALSYVGMVRDSVDDVDGLNGARAVAVSPDGRYVYVASQWDNAVAVFSRDGATGELTFLEACKDADPGTDGLNIADGIALSPDGGFVYVGGYGDDALVVLSHLSEIYLPVVVRNG